MVQVPFLFAALVLVQLLWLIAQAGEDPELEREALELDPLHDDELWRGP
jgi:hypothetical protein